MWFLRGWSKVEVYKWLRDLHERECWVVVYVADLGSPGDLPISKAFPTLIVPDLSLKT